MNDAHLAELQRESWAMEPRALQAFFLAAVEFARHGGINTAQEESPSLLRIDNGAGVISIRGALLKSVPEWARGRATAYRDISSAVNEAANNGAVSTIVLHVESPGGTVAGLEDCADVIYAARTKKPVQCIVEDMCASGGYWLASQAQNNVANPTAEIGSIGVYTAMLDLSKMYEEVGARVVLIKSGEFKGTGFPGAPITDPQAEAVQETIDALHARFVNAANRGRSSDITPFCNGRTWIATAAKEIGLIDECKPVQEAFANARQTINQRIRLMNEDREKAAQELADAKTQAANDERARATALAEAFAEDPAFALAQIKAGATLADAKAAYADKLAEDLKAVKAEKAALEEQIASAKPQQQQAQGAPVAPHGEPASAGNSPDFMAVATARKNEKNISLTAAMREIAAENPDLHKQFTGRK